MTERARLTDALALAARPREREYAIHDSALQGFMLRVQPNGARSWVFRFRRDGKPRRVTLGKPGAVKAEDARAAALAFFAREKGGGNPLPLPASGPTLTKFAAECVGSACRRSCVGSHDRPFALPGKHDQVRAPIFQVRDALAEAGIVQVLEPAVRCRVRHAPQDRQIGPRRGTCRGQLAERGGRARLHPDPSAVWPAIASPRFA